MKILSTIVFFLLSSLNSQEKIYWPSEEELTGLEILPGDTAIPKKQRQVPGFLIDIDYKTRKAKLLGELDSKVYDVLIMPHAEILYHGSHGRLEDIIVNEHVALRLHPDKKGSWHFASYVKTNLNHLFSHKQMWRLESYDKSTGEITGDVFFYQKNKIRMPFKAYITKETSYLGGKKTDLKKGSLFYVKTFGNGKDSRRFVSEVIYDHELFKSKYLQKQKNRIEKEEREQGSPAYIDSNRGRMLKVTIFREASKMLKPLKKNTEVQISLAEWNLTPYGFAFNGKVIKSKMKGSKGMDVYIELEEEAKFLSPKKICRIKLSQ